MTGSIIWRCGTCKKNTTARACTHPRARYHIKYQVGGRQKWEAVGRSKKDAERRLARLLSVVKGNLAYGVFQAIEAAKLALSERTEATIELPDVDLCVPITRAAFEALLEPLLDEVDACIAALLKNAGVSADDVDVVVRTGGTSQIPAVRRRLAAHFGDRVVEHGVFTSIAAGLALASWHGHAPPLD